MRIVKRKPEYLVTLLNHHCMVATYYTVGQEKKNTFMYFNANYRTEMKLVPITMDYCLLQFDALKFFLVVSLH